MFNDKDLQEYFDRETKRSVQFKLVVAAMIDFGKPWRPQLEYENWAGNWTINGIDHFLVKIVEGRGEEANTYNIFCWGTDDMFLEKRMISLNEAKDIFNKIKDGMSKEELIFFFGFTYG